MLIYASWQFSFPANGKKLFRPFRFIHILVQSLKSRHLLFVSLSSSSCIGILCISRIVIVFWACQQSVQFADFSKDNFFHASLSKTLGKQRYSRSFYMIVLKDAYRNNDSLTLSLRFFRANLLCSLHSAPWEKTIPPPPSSPVESSDLKKADIIHLKFLGRPENLSSLKDLPKEQDSWYSRHLTLYLCPFRLMARAI